MTKTLTVCPYCGCGCGLYLENEENEIIGVIPSQNHPLNLGSLCIRGWYCYEYLQSQERLTKPLIKKPNGEFEESSWENALALVSEKFGHFKQKSEGSSLAIIGSTKCTNEDNYLLGKWARSVLGTNNIDNLVRISQAPGLVAFQQIFDISIPPYSFDQINDSQVIMVIGFNATEILPQIGSRIIQALNNGAKLIVVDPKVIQLAKLADLHLQLNPNTDLVIINALLKTIIEENLIDQAAVSERVSNFESIKDHLAKFTPELFEKTTGIKKEQVLEAAKLLTSGKSTILFSTGLTQQINGTDNVFSLINLSLINGTINREYFGLLPVFDDNNTRGVCDMGLLPNYLPGYQNLSKKKKFEQKWGVNLPEKEGLTIMEMIDEALQGKIKAMMIMGENSLITIPNSSKTEEALKKVEFLVVQDVFMTETAKLAHVILPAAGFSEKEGTFTNTAGYVQLLRKISDPLGESKPDWEIIMNLSSKMGYKMEYQSPEQIMEEIASLLPMYGQIQYKKLEELGGQKLAGKELSLRKIKLPLTDWKPQNEINEEFPFFLIAGRIAEHWQSGMMSRSSPTLLRECPQGFAYINPLDAQTLKIRDGFRIKIISRRGEVSTTARLTEKVPEKIVFIPIHFPELRAHLLTTSDLDKKSKTPSSKYCGVRIEV